jgi:hypothetical protein
MGYLGLPIGSGDVEQAPEDLHATPVGVEWLGADLAAQVGKLQSPVNRGVPTRDASPAVVLVAGADMGFIGGYRLDGWGWLWRVGGFNPDPQAVLPVATAALGYVYAHPPVPPAAAGVRSLWHLVVRKG